MPRRLPDNRFRGIRNVSKSKKYRLFLAIFPPQEYITYFRDVIRLLDKQKRNVKSNPVDQIHMTLKYIGSEVSEHTKDIILEDFQNLSGQFPPPEIKIKKIQLGFPYQTDPVHIIAELENSPSLIYLANIIHSRLKVIDRDDTIRWKMKHSDSFHITLGRIKPKKAKSIGREVNTLIEKIDFPAPDAFVPEYMELMESEITAQGPVYKKLARIKL